jgi:hypothetical protein
VQVGFLGRYVFAARCRTTRYLLGASDMTTLADVLAAHRRLSEAEQEAKDLRKRYAEEAAPFKPGDTIPERKVHFTSPWTKRSEERIEKGFVVVRLTLAIDDGKAEWYFQGKALKKDGTPGLMRESRVIPADEEGQLAYMLTLREVSK